MRGVTLSPRTPPEERRRDGLGRRAHWQDAAAAVNRDPRLHRRGSRPLPAISEPASSCLSSTSTDLVGRGELRDHRTRRGPRTHAAKATPNAPDAPRRAEKSAYVEDKAITIDGSERTLAIYARGGAIGSGELTETGDLILTELQQADFGAPEPADRVPRSDRRRDRPSRPTHLARLSPAQAPSIGFSAE